MTPTQPGPRARQASSRVLGRSSLDERRSARLRRYDCDVTNARIDVRPARSSDATAIRAIDHDASRESEIRQAAEQPRYIVAELDGIVAGFAVGSRLYGFDFLELLVVSAAHRRRGVGSALVRGWEATADTPKLFTSTNDSNIPMQRLCEGLGYARSGLIQNLDEGDPEIVYFKPNPRTARAGSVEGPPATPMPVPERVAAAHRRAQAAGFEMSSDDDVGRLLAVLAAGTGPGGRILELGTGAGVGLAWILEGLTDRAHVEVVSVERDGDLHRRLSSEPRPENVRLVLGDALSLMPELGPFDLIFADAPAGKLEGLDRTVEALSPGGFLVLDDMIERPSDPVHASYWPRISQLRSEVVGHPQLRSVEMTWSSGVVLACKIGAV